MVPFENDTSIIVTSSNLIKFENNVNKVFQDRNRWFTTNLLSLNVEKIQFMQFVTMTNSPLDLITMHKNKKSVNIHNKTFLGLILDIPSLGSFIHTHTHTHTHRERVVTKLSSAYYVIRTVKPFLSKESFKMAYCSYFHWIITYKLIFWVNSCYNKIIFILRKTKLL
jgi:hypothetical protein